MNGRVVFETSMTSHDCFADRRGQISKGFAVMIAGIGAEVGWISNYGIFRV